MNALRLIAFIGLLAIPLEANARQAVVVLRDGGLLIGEVDPALGHLRTAFGVIELPSEAVASQLPLDTLPPSPPLRFRTSSGQLHVGSALKVEAGVLTIRRADGQREALELKQILEINDLARIGPSQAGAYPLPTVAVRPPEGANAPATAAAQSSGWPSVTPQAPSKSAPRKASKPSVAAKRPAPIREKAASAAKSTECSSNNGAKHGQERGESPKPGSSDANAFMRSAVAGFLCPGIDCLSSGIYAGYKKYKAPTPAKCADSPEFVAAYEKAFVQSRKGLVKPRTWLGGALGTAVGVFLLVQIANGLDEDL